MSQIYAWQFFQFPGTIKANVVAMQGFWERGLAVVYWSFVGTVDSKISDNVVFFTFFYLGKRCIRVNSNILEFTDQLLEKIALNVKLTQG